VTGIAVPYLNKILGIWLTLPRIGYRITEMLLLFDVVNIVKQGILTTFVLTKTITQPL
jgi:hypothetical protein